MARGRGAGLAALILTVFTGLVGFGIFIPIFPFLALDLGASAHQTTLAMGAYSLGQLIAAPAWGRLSDRIGRKPVLIIGLAGGAMSYVLLTFADSWATLGAARLFGGLMAGNIGAAFAAAADLADERTRARNMGLLGATFAGAFIIGPGVGALIIGDHPSTEGYHRICFVAAGFTAAAGLYAAAFFRESHPPAARKTAGAPRARRWALLRARPILTRLLIVALVMITAQALVESTFGLWADAALGWGPREVGVAFTGLGALTALLQGGGAGRLARIFGERRLLLAGLATFALGLALLAGARDAIQAGLGLFVLACGGGIATPALTSLVSAQAGEDERGVVMGLNQSAGALGRVIGPATSGAIFDALGAGAPFAVGAALLVGAWALAWMGARARQSNKDA